MPPSERSPVRKLLGPGPFRRYLAASTFTSLANGTTRFAFVWAMGDLTDWEPALGLLGVMLGLPALVFSPLSGMLADRHDRRHVAAASSAILALACALVGFVLFADAVGALGLGAAAFVLSIPLASVSPALQSMVPVLARREHLMNAVALQNLSMMGSMIVGAFLGGAVITVAGTDAAFWVMAGVSAIAAVQLVSLPAVAGRPRGDSHERSQPVTMRAGLEQVRSDPVVGVLLGIAGCIGVGSATAMLFLPQLAREELDASAFGAGLLNASMSLGLIVTASVLATRVTVERPGRIVALMFTLIAGPGLIAVSLAPNLGVAAIVVLGWGMGGGVVMTLQRTMIQQRTADHLMGRIMGLFNLAQYGTFPLGAVALFVLSGPLGVRGTFVAIGCALTLAAGMLGLALRRLEMRELDQAAPVAV